MRASPRSAIASTSPAASQQAARQQPSTASTRLPAPSAASESFRPPTAYGALVAYHGALYLIGGKTAAGAPDATVLRIDPQTGTTTVAARLPQGLAEPAAVALADRIVVIGGENSNAVYELTPR